MRYYPCLTVTIYTFEYKILYNTNVYLKGSCSHKTTTMTVNPVTHGPWSEHLYKQVQVMYKQDKIIGSKITTQCHEQWVQLLCHA